MIFGEVALCMHSFPHGLVSMQQSGTCSQPGWQQAVQAAYQEPCSSTHLCIYCLRHHLIFGEVALCMHSFPHGLVSMQQSGTCSQPGWQQAVQAAYQEPCSSTHLCIYCLRHQVIFGEVALCMHPFPQGLMSMLQSGTCSQPGWQQAVQAVNREPCNSTYLCIYCLRHQVIFGEVALCMHPFPQGLMSMLQSGTCSQPGWQQAVQAVNPEPCNSTYLCIYCLRHQVIFGEVALCMHPFPQGLMSMLQSGTCSQPGWQQAVQAVNQEPCNSTYLCIYCLRHQVIFGEVALCLQDLSLCTAGMGGY